LIADDDEDIFMGASLNGMRKRYALLDILNDEDAKQIATLVNELR
jgi:hypothetical protein